MVLISPPQVLVICKVHGRGVRADLYKEGTRLDDVNETRSGEVLKLSFRIPFSDESFKLYTCIAASADGTGEAIQAKVSMFYELSCICMCS